MNYVHSLFKDIFFFNLNIIKEMKYNTSLSTGSHRFRKKKKKKKKLFLLQLYGMKPVIHTEIKERYSRSEPGEKIFRETLPVLKQSPWIGSPQESLIDVRFKEARVAIPGHQTVDELLRCIKRSQGRLGDVLCYVFSGTAVYVDLESNSIAQGRFTATPLIIILCNFLGRGNCA